MATKHIKIFDTTLRDGEQSPGCTMNLFEKLELALQLERLGVDIIEAGFAASSPGDFESVSSIARAVKGCTVASLSRALKSDIDASYSAVKLSNSPRIHVFIATSPLHMQYKLRMSPDKVIERIKESVSYARSLCPDVEFSAEDFSRSDIEFATAAMQAAIDSGATVLNCPDTVGYSTPVEMAQKVRYLLTHLHGIERVELSAHNHDDLGLAVANSLAMVEAGVTQIECTINGIGERAGNTSLEEVVMALMVRHNHFGATTNINTKEIYRSSKLVSTVTGVRIAPSKAIVGANAFAHESGIHQHGVLANPETYEIMKPEDVGIPQNKIVLGKHSGKHAFSEHVKSQGYTLSEAELAQYFEEFKRLCDKKKYVSNKDIAAMLSQKLPESRSLKLVDYSVSCGKEKTASATVVFSGENGTHSATASGDGPVDSAFNALNAALEREIVLDEYSLSSVTEGRDAMAEAVVRLNFNGLQGSGTGVSTDVVEASILAYLSAAEKLI